MKLLLLLPLLLLTAPDGSPVYIIKSQLAAVIESTACAIGSNAKLILSGGQPICVKETIDTVIKKLNGQ